TRSVAAIGAISDTIGELDRVAAVIAGAMEHQSDAAREIAVNVNRAARNVDHVSSAISEIETIVGDTATAADNLGHSAVEVTTQTDQIRSRIRSFTEELRDVAA